MCWCIIFLIYMFGDNFGSYIYRFTGFACNYFLFRSLFIMVIIFKNTYSVYRLCSVSGNPSTCISGYLKFTSPPPFFFFYWCSFHFLNFFLLCFVLISIAVLYSSPVFSSVMSNLPLIPSSIFFFSGIVVFVSSGFIWMLLHLTCLYLTF